MKAIKKVLFGSCLLCLLFTMKAIAAEHVISEATSSWDLNNEGTVKGYWFEEDRHLEIQGNGYTGSNLNGSVDSAIIRSVNIGSGVKAAGQYTANSMFFQWYDLQGVTFEDAAGFTEEITDMNQMFGSCYALKKVDLSGFNTSNTTCMSYMFCDAKNLESVDISGFDTSNVTNMSGMFWGCDNLKSVKLDGIDTSKVSDMGLMFSGCKSLTSVNLKGLNTSDVHDMWGMFEKCESLTELDLSTWNTSSCVKYMGMFQKCKSLKNLNISGFDMSKDYDTSSTYMLEDCDALEKLITPKVGATNTHLPKTMYDSNGATYKRLPATSTTLYGSFSESGATAIIIEDKTIAPKKTISIKSELMEIYKQAFPDAVVKKVKFKSSDKKIAKVNKKGIVTGKKKTGTAKITMYVKTQITITKSNGKAKKKLSKWTEAGSVNIINTGNI